MFTVTLTAEQIDRMLDKLPVRDFADVCLILTRAISCSDLKLADVFSGTGDRVALLTRQAG